MINALEQSEAQTVERFNRSQDRVIRDFGSGDTIGALAIAKANLRKLSEAISELMADNELSGDKRKFVYVIRNLDPDVVAFSVLNTVLESVSGDHKLTTCVKRIGQNLAGECWAAGLTQTDRQLARRINKTVKAKHGNLKYRRQAQRSMAAKAGYRFAKWTTEECVRAGGYMLDLIQRTMPDVFVIETLAEKEKTTKIIAVSQEAVDLAEAAVELALTRNPMFVPTVDKPEDWTGWDRGGYWDERCRIKAQVLRSFAPETETAVKLAMRDGSMKPHLDALNALQAVPFKINQRVLGVLNLAYVKGIKVKGVPTRKEVPAPEKDKPWDLMTDAEKEIWKDKAEKIKAHNRTLLGTRLTFKRDIVTARELTIAPEFYVPLNCDWRGRFNAVPHFAFARDDRVRALFLFARGEPLGEDGLYWLKVHTANCGDFDKISKQPLDARAAWVDANMEKIIACTQDPLAPTALSLWTAADKPFLFLAACLELAEAVKSPTPKDFITHLPIAFDGSCSGLQHLTAMTRAPEGSLVNLTPQDKPQDIYQTVADVVKAEVEKDLANPDLYDLAVKCLAFGITRKVVKRNVMTYCYGSVAFGMTGQLESDLLEPLRMDVLTGKLSDNPFGEYASKPFKSAHSSPASNYLANKVYDAIKSVVSLPEQAKVFLQQIAKALATEGKPVRWTTPTGVPWVNRYFTKATKRVSLNLHDVEIQLSVGVGETDEIRSRKSQNGISPNFVHALDASHLALTVNQAVAEGIIDLATVHDSFGCLASSAGRFRQIIREQFVRMYEEHDVLAEILDAAKRDLNVHNWQLLPGEIEYGNLRLQDVIEAEYAFA